MFKVWKIGTSSMSYIREFLGIIKLYHGSDITIKRSGKNVSFIIDGKVAFTKHQSTASQFLRVLLGVGIIDAGVTFEKDNLLISDKTTYEIIYNEGIELCEHMISQLISAYERIFEEEELIFPSEKEFVISIIAIIFQHIETDKTIKLINKNLLSHTIEDISKYYIELATEICKSKQIKTLFEIWRDKIVGFNEDEARFIKSIDGNISNNYEEHYSPKNLKDLLWSEPKTFGQFIKDYFNAKLGTVIPVYQRKYIWPESNVKVLLDDIFNVEYSHYIGNIITQSVQAQPKMISKIIDGQQRITTLLLILRALYDFSKFKDYPVDRMINEKMMFERSDSIYSGFEHIKGNNDYDVFKLCIKGDLFKDSEKKYKSEVIMLNYKFTLKWINTYLTSKDKIKMFWDNLLNCVVMNIVDAKNENEYLLFEKLNTGGMPLTTIELFKNYILDSLGKIGNINEEKAQEEFANKIENNFASTTGKKISRAKIDNDIDTFIITSLRMHNSKLNDNSLFNQYKSLIENIQINDPSLNLYDILEIISREIKMYKEISVYSNFNSENSILRHFADFLYMLDGRTIYYPLILRIINIHIKNIDDPQLKEINKIREYFRVIEIFEVRMQVASYRGQSLSTKIEKILMKLNDETSPLDFWNIFSEGSEKSSGMASVELFVSTLENQSIINKSAKLIMTRIENYFHLNKGWKLNSKEDTKFIGLFDKKSQREHLLPSSWEEHWKKYLITHTKKTYDKLIIDIKESINLIGNAFPIPAWSNKSMKNKSYKDKMDAAEKNSYTKNMILFNGIDGELEGARNSFTPEIIKNRTKQIAKIAKEIWKDFK